MKKLLLIATFISVYTTTLAQQYALFGTQSMFDAFENPSQKSFTLDSSRKFSSNFLLPYFNINAANSGSSDNVVRRFIQEGTFDTRNLPLGHGDINRAFVNSNIYVATFRIFQSYKYQKELGFSWQIRTDGQANYTNENLAIFDSYTRFPQGVELNGIFNASGYQESYHQFSFTYRENWDKRLAFGLKLSILSGISYIDGNINNSRLFINGDDNYLRIGLNGDYRSTITDTEKFNKNTVIPNFKNPGLSFGFGTNYKTKKGLFLMANIKDLGFIWWRNNPQQNTLNANKVIENIDYNQDNTNQEIKDIFVLNNTSKKFLTPTNAKIDVYLSKQFSFYKPGLAISKNLFYKGGDVAFVNTFNYDNLSASVTPTYNFNKIFMLGLQGKYQTPNFEFFMGTENLIGTGYFANGLLNDRLSGTGHNGASFYMGIGIKFGNVVNHPQFSDMIPGINDKDNGSLFRWFKSLF